MTATATPRTNWAGNIAFAAPDFYRPASLAELRAGLGDGTALVAYVVTAERVVALTVTGDGTDCVDLGDRARLDGLLGGLLPDLDVAASDVSGALGGLVRRQLAQRLDELAAELVHGQAQECVGSQRCQPYLQVRGRAVALHDRR